MAKFLAANATPEGFESFYNVVYRDQGFKMAPHMRPIAHALMDQRIKKLMIIIGPGLGKSLMISVAYPAHRLGINPAEQIIGVSAGESLIQGFTDSTGNIIESKEYEAIFPGTRPDKSDGWSSSGGLNVTGRPKGTPDASFFACGIESKALPGKHCTTLIMDDIHNAQNSATADQCEKIVAKYYNTVLGRADPRGCRFIVVGRRWHQNDIYGELAKSGEYVTMTLPAERPGTDQLWIDVEVPNGLVCCFNEDGK